MAEAKPPASGKSANPAPGSRGGRAGARPGGRPAAGSTTSGTRAGGTPRPTASKQAGAKQPGTKPAGSKSASSKAAGSKAPGGRPAGVTPTRRKPSTSIVERPQRPWGLIATTVVIVLFAVGVIGYAIKQGRDDSSKASAIASIAPATATPEEIAKIEGITVKTGFTRNHQTTVVDYGQDSPPFGGDHSPYWAQCTGVVYPNPIASENAIHPLEHGAIWVTYKPGIDKAEIDALAQRVQGINYMFMSPYPGLKTNVSLQAWGYQLFVDSASDPRIDQFITSLRLNKTTTPEYGASCDDPAFKANQSTPGHPFNG